MKKLLLISLVSVFALTSCHWHRIRGNGSIKTETRDVAAFEAIACDGGYEVQIDCQAKQSLAIETDENLLPRIKTEVHNNTLHIDTKGNLFPTHGIRIAVSVPNITEFTSNGSTDGDINNINNSTFDVGIHGSGKLHLNGKSGTVNIHTSGSSKIDATSLISENSDIQINGSGNMQVYVTNSLGVQINGSGTVKYKGEPKSVNQQINGSGKIERE
jgi:hypothetical protein